MELFERTAYHEAAHAMIGIVLGKHVQHIIMQDVQHGHETRDYGGCRFVEQDSEWTNKDYATVRYAGGRAEFRDENAALNMLESGRAGPSGVNVAGCGERSLRSPRL